MTGVGWLERSYTTMGRSFSRVYRINSFLTRYPDSDW
jgi:hypothetical protein